MDFDNAVKEYFRRKLENSDAPLYYPVDWDEPVALIMDFEPGSSCPTCGDTGRVRIHFKYSAIYPEARIRSLQRRTQPEEWQPVDWYFLDTTEVNLSDLMKEIIAIGFET